jgi:hypothetical protein
MIENLIHQRIQIKRQRSTSNIKLNVLNILLKGNWGARGLPKYKIEQYFVAAIGDEIIGACGINFEDNGKSAKISWDFKDPKFKEKGVGQSLLKYRVNFIKIKLQCLNR